MQHLKRADTALRGGEASGFSKSASDGLVIFEVDAALMLELGELKTILDGAAGSGTEGATAGASTTGSSGATTVARRRAPRVVGAAGISVFSGRFFAIQRRRRRAGILSKALGENFGVSQDTQAAGEPQKKVQ